MPLRTLISILLAGAAAHAAPDGRVPVVVELFTSEGCSSCPPADEVLVKLSRIQNVSNARVIVLGEHVDYWNNLGWVDPFSSPQFRARQNDYAQVFKVHSVYTPQMVVNGRAEFVGDDMGRAMSEIGHAASQPSATVSVKAAKNSTNQELVDLEVSVRDLPAITIRGKRGVAPVDVYLAVTEDNLTTDVKRGENSGHTLRHAAVVRSFGVIGNMDPREKGELSLRPTLKIPSNWKRKDLHAVVFVQDRSTRHILGAESVGLN
jgi:hypothetical protein